MTEPFEIRARTVLLRVLERLQTDFYTEYSGEIDDDVYDALQSEIDICIQGIKDIKLDREDPKWWKGRRV